MLYQPNHIILHWISAGLVLWLVYTGLAYSFDWAGDWAITAHQITGQILIGVIVLRLMARAQTSPQPGHDADRPTWQKTLSRAVHLGLYAVLIAFVITGYVSASALREPALIAPVSQGFARSDMGETLLEVHFALKWALLGFLALHIAGAAKQMLTSTPSNMIMLKRT